MSPNPNLTFNPGQQTNAQTGGRKLQVQRGSHRCRRGQPCGGTTAGDAGAKMSVRVSAEAVRHFRREEVLQAGIPEAK